MEEKLIEDMIGSCGGRFIAGIEILMFRSAIEGRVEGVKIIIGTELNTDDVVELKDRHERVTRGGMMRDTCVVQKN